MSSETVPSSDATGDVFGQYAGFATRFIAFIADLILIIVIIVGITAVAELIQNFLGFHELTNTLLNIWVAVSSLVVLQGYFIVFWMLTGQTPGLYLMGLRVVRVDGGRVTIGVAVLRLVGYYVSAFLFLGYIWVLIDNRRQGWHDKLAGTLVVYAWSYDKDLERGKPLQSRADTRRRRLRAASTGE